MISSEALMSALRTLVALEPEPPTESRVREFVDRLWGPDLDAGDADEIIRLVSQELAILVDRGTEVVTRDARPWLASRRHEIDWARSNAFFHMLRTDGRAPLVIQTLDHDTDRILDLSGNPAEATQWARRGLVLGDVQAGKTSTYLALMNKAADSGYRLFIVLGGHTEKLRKQTQERVDEGFIGREGASFSKRETVGKRIGIARHSSALTPFQSLTTPQYDFGKQALKQLNLSIEAGSYVLVLKKNIKIFEAVTAWLRQQRQHGKDKLDVPMMLLDDESDYASVNTRKPEQDPTRINDAIRKMLGLFSRNSYVAFTATPFANIFIDHTNENDLFPRDFIYSLRTPSNYVGSEKVLGSADAPIPKQVRLIEDAEDPTAFPIGHKSGHHVTELPDSCKEAIRSFVLFNALRDLRGAGPAPRSMLINVSQFMSVQGQVYALVADHLDGLKASATLHARSPRWSESNALRDLHSTYSSLFSDHSTWDDVRQVLPSAVSGMRVGLFNSETSKDSHELENVERLIAVGGNVLSRGLTLRGLGISYFYRAPRASDTLLQMARWYGYRDGYEDLCRLWLEAGVAKDFKEVQEAVDGLREDFVSMHQRGLTPVEFGLAVKHHPEALRVTASNKMQAAQLAPRRVSLFGERCETTRLSADFDDRGQNWRNFQEFLATLRDHMQESSGHHLVWREVPSKSVADFVADYVPHDFDRKFHPASLSAFIEGLGKGDYPLWDVILVSGKDGGHAVSAAGHRIVPSPRSTTYSAPAPSSLLVSGGSTRLAGRTDIRLAFSPDRYKTLLNSLGSKNPAETEFYKYLPRPVLFLYPLWPKFPGQVPSDYEPSDFPLVAIKYALRGSKESAGSDQLYYLNTVAQGDYMPEYLDEADWEDLDDSE